MRRGALTVRIPNQHRGDIAGGLLRRILKQAEISDDDWMQA